MDTPSINDRRGNKLDMLLAPGLTLRKNEFLARNDNSAAPNDYLN